MLPHDNGMVHAINKMGKTEKRERESALFTIFDK